MEIEYLEHMGNRKAKNQLRDTVPMAQRLADKAKIAQAKYIDLLAPRYWPIDNLQMLLDYLGAKAMNGNRRAIVYNLMPGIVTALRLEKFTVTQIAMAASDYTDGSNHNSTKWKISW